MKKKGGRISKVSRIYVCKCDRVPIGTCKISTNASRPSKTSMHRCMCVHIDARKLNSHQQLSMRNVEKFATGVFAHGFIGSQVFQISTRVKLPGRTGYNPLK